MVGSVRVAVALNAGPRAGKPQAAAALVAPDGAALHAHAVKRLRLNKKNAEAARLFLWTRDSSCAPLASNVRVTLAFRVQRAEETTPIRTFAGVAVSSCHVSEASRGCFAMMMW